MSMTQQALRYLKYIYWWCQPLNFNNLFLHTEYTSLGCWTDTDTRAITTLEGMDPRLDGEYKTRTDPINKCFEVAKDLGFPAFGIQNGGWCCGAVDALKTYTMYGAATNCIDGEGGDWANDIYKIESKLLSFDLMCSVNNNL